MDDEPDIFRNRSTAGKFDQRRVRWASVAFAVALFLYAISRMVMLPVA